MKNSFRICQKRSTTRTYCSIVDNAVHYIMKICSSKISFDMQILASNFEKGYDKGHSQEIPKPRVLTAQTTNTVSVNQIQLRGFRTRALGTLFHKMNTDLMTI